MTLEARSLKRLEAQIVTGLLWQTELASLVPEVASSSVVEIGQGRLRFLGIHEEPSRPLASYSFEDSDGVHAHAALRVDAGGGLYEFSLLRDDGFAVLNLRLGILPARRDFFATVSH